MAPTDGPRQVLHGPGARVELRYRTPQHAEIRVDTRHDHGAGPAAGRLVRRAVSGARGRGTSVVTTVVDGSSPSGGALLDALRSRVGTDVIRLTMRRAGSSVMVTADLAPPHRPCTPARRTTVRRRTARTPRRSR